MQDAVLQSSLPFLPWMDPRTARLPGILPVEPRADGRPDWLRVDDAFAGQMRLRDHLISTRPEAVHALSGPARPAAQELYARVLSDLAATPGYRIGRAEALRPDGVAVALEAEAPLLTLGRLVQEDLCLMEQAEPGGEHALTGAILCFPASWTLAQKIGRPLVAIHRPVAPYDEGLARRVQRLFDAIRPEQPLWRMNWLTYDDPALHQPRAEGESRPDPSPDSSPDIPGPHSGAAPKRMFVRCERQCLLRLPASRAVVFSIHSYVVRAATLPPEALARLIESRH
ncbi:heme-dependent oxidative N-demethylase family protein [Pseudogemmobacter sonorensis]|uniref:heme-dependent oxidative N-demethylase family protein n=1 Tax=Pseudogemmobacter sonorensis TaxID=2989681 RepID=UPI00368CB930